ncbi:MAG TPA: UvrD-helicase domain-containing protein, partial [Planctomycetaceae bacterium]|nr:UvrD-helicase domain-containing protein [Planctomycetaceae bacterium]
AAVEHFEGPLLVLAGPGSGKTRVITHRIARLIERGVPPRNILGLTFTNKAAEEMAHRVEVLVAGSRVWVSTFHRFCARLLREYAEHVGLQSNFSIFDTDDQRGIIKHVLRDLDLDSTQYAPARIGAAISRLKNDLVTLDQVEHARREATLDFQTVVVSKVLPEYQKQLRESNAVDFDDLLLHVVALLRDNPELRGELDHQYRFILVDEYQDTNRAQYELIRGLSQDVPNLCATGDPDQSIYGWRGARIDNILRFESDYPNAAVVRLEDNFRSTKAILRVADSLIEHNIHRKAKRLRTHNEAGDKVRLHRFWNGKHEADEVASQIRADFDAGVWNWSDIAIFYRVNWLSREIEMALSRHRIPYQVAAGLAFYDRAEVKDMLAYLRAIENPADRAATLRIINNPPRGIGKNTLEKLTRFAEKHELTLLEATPHAREIPNLSAAPTKALLAFSELMHGLREKAHGPVADLLRTVLAQTGYGDEWRSSDDEQEQQRLGNVTELILSAQQFDESAGREGSLQAFLETTALVSDSDVINPEAGAVTLMTLHAAKGLEFRVVFILGFEQNLIPHERALNDRDDDRRALFALEEERRLLFVGMTRAMKQLHLTQCVERYSFGRPLHTLPSQFQTEIECEAIDHTGVPPLGPKFGIPIKPSIDEDSQEVPDDFLDFDFGASAKLDRETSHEPADDAEELGEASEMAFGESPSAATPQATLPDLKSKLTTGAALLSTRGTASDATASFAVGNSVRHPRYGLGTVVEVGQMLTRQTVIVQFEQDARRETFVADKCPLTLIGLR